MRDIEGVAVRLGCQRVGHRGRRFPRGVGVEGDARLRRGRRRRPLGLGLGRCRARRRVPDAAAGQDGAAVPGGWSAPRTRCDRLGLGVDGGRWSSPAAWRRDRRRFRLRCPRRDVDFRHHRAGRRRVDGRAEVREVGLDCRAHAVAVTAGVRLERVGVGLQTGAACDELRDLGFEAAALSFVDAPRGDFGLTDERLGLRLRLVEDLARPLLRFGDRVVGGALREDQRALDGVGVVAAGRRHRSLGRRARWRLLDLAREVLDRDCGALEEVVDLVAVVAAERLFDLAPAELLRCYVHETSVHRRDFIAGLHHRCVARDRAPS